MKNVVAHSFSRFVFLAALGSASLAGCREAHPARSVVDCRIDLVEPYLGPLALEAVRAAMLGNPAPLRDSLLGLGLEPAEVIEISKKWHACMPQPPAPDAGS